MEEERVFQTVAPGDLVLTDNSEYVQVPAGEPFEAHICSVETTQNRKFDNPDELETVLVVRFKLDSEVEGKGQVYTAWLRPSLNAKSKMYKLLVAVYSGSVPSPLDVTDLLGRPLRMTLTEGIEKSGRKRQYVESYLKPRDSQKRVKIEKPILPDDVDIENLDVDKLFESV